MSDNFIAYPIVARDVDYWVDEHNAKISIPSAIQSVSDLRYAVGLDYRLVDTNPQCHEYIPGYGTCIDAEYMKCVKCNSSLCEFHWHLYNGLCHSCYNKRYGNAA